MERKWLMVIIMGSLAANIVLGLFLLKNQGGLTASNKLAVLEQKYPLLSKRILLDFPQDLLINFLDMRNKLHKQVDEYGDSFGLYFEYLPTGTSVSINSQTEFYAASLFKIPVVMAYYHMRERLHKTDDPTLTILPDQIDKDFGTLWQKGAGTKIKASEAVSLTLKQSDNTAVRALVPLIPEEDFKAVYQALDIDLQVDKEGALISAKSYSSILKAAYFASVLNKEDSQDILDQLSKTDFIDRMVAGVDPSVTVSHKIGDFHDDKGNEGFRDCGIVYVPRRSYILCMYSVSDEVTAKERMRLASKTVYDYVISSE